jgi:lysophospholipid acyltransferase (LPLAT)-like uncharacterized protein
MAFTLKKRVTISVIAWLVTSIFRLWFLTVRVKINNKDIYDEYFKQINGKKRVVAVSWHRHSIFLFYFFRNLGDRLILISQSRDGEITAGVAKQLGYTPVRGSSSRGGTEALQALINEMNSKDKSYLCGTPVDGPKGPARKVKKGMVVLAKETGSYLIPMACSGTRVITFSKSWDNTILPKPFSKVVVGFDTPRKISQTLTDEELETTCLQLENDLNALTDKVDDICGYTG